MADNICNSGIIADGYRPMAVLCKDNYRAWSYNEGATQSNELLEAGHRNKGGASYYGFARSRMSRNSSSSRHKGCLGEKEGPCSRAFDHVH